MAPVQPVAGENNKLLRLEFYGIAKRFLHVSFLSGKL